MRDSDSWYTPVEILSATEDFFGQMIGFDPTCSPDAPAWGFAAHKLTKDDDALSMEIWAERGPLFLNMPYSNPAPYVKRAIEYAGRRRTFASEGYEDTDARAITLTNAATSTKWCQALLEAADFACFASPRIRFLRRRLDPDKIPMPRANSVRLALEKWRKAVATEVALPTIYRGLRGIELVQPSSPRYENLICGFGGHFEDFERAFGAFGYCTELT